MGVHHEVVLVACSVGCLGQGTLDPCGEGHILEASARGAQQVVVVLRELLGQLVARDVVGRGEPVHRSALLEDREVAVERALGLFSTGVDELGDRHGTVGVQEQVDELAAPQRVALARPSQLVVDRFVDLGAHVRQGSERSRNG